MNAAPRMEAERRWPEQARWAGCFALALLFHAAGAAALLARWTDAADAIVSAPVILVDLAPVAAAPQTLPTELPPGPQQTEARSEPAPAKPAPNEQKFDRTVETPVALTPPPESPKEKKLKPERRASLTSAPSPAEQRANRAAAPMPGAGARDADALPNWKSLLVAQLERNKRFPAEAQARGDHGVAQLAFSIDRRGSVHNARIVRSSGSALLDRETLALVQRAQPLPPPPPEISGAQIAIVVPIRYNMR